ncbi:hypothetical protein ACFWF7_43685 [Nocardia sp. NPDC060256]|uniref:hypothetical protein n=1 Tax=unclassified Nocardia TaxID=2637762 RepID=UPI0036480DFC
MTSDTVPASSEVRETTSTRIFVPRCHFAKTRHGWSDREIACRTEYMKGVPGCGSIGYRAVVAMEWVAVVGTLSGAAVGAGTTLLVDLIKARRDRSQRFQDAQRGVYAKYLEALVKTDIAVQALAMSQATPLSNADATAAFRSHQLVAARFELELVAPQEITDAAEVAYDALNAVRVTLTTTSVTVGHRGVGSPEWLAVHEPFRMALDSLRQAMRAGLNPDRLPYSS